MRLCAHAAPDSIGLTTVDVIEARRRRSARDRQIITLVNLSLACSAEILITRPGDTRVSAIGNRQRGESERVRMGGTSEPEVRAFFDATNFAAD